MSFLHGSPPEVVRLAIGNAGTDMVADLLIRQQAEVETFFLDEQASLLILA